MTVTDYIREALLCKLPKNFVPTQKKIKSEVR